jgi:hypothetical protein
MKEKENFQAWLAHNRDRPLSGEVMRLQGLVNRLEVRHGADSRRLRKANLEWWSLLRKEFLVCLGLVALLLWFMNSYLDSRGALEKLCAFIAREASPKIENRATRLRGDLKDAHGVCSEEGALP